MRFGQIFKLTIFINLFLLLHSCKTTTPFYLSFKSPDQGQVVKSGDSIMITLAINPEATLKTIEYLIDGQHVTTKMDNRAFKWPSSNLKLGYRLLTAIVNYTDQTDTLHTNIVLKSDVKPKAIRYKVIESFRHDTSAYTQGLSYVDGKLLESTGQKGKSVLKYVDLQSGATLQQAELDPHYFGEGSLKLDDKIIMLTWLEEVGLVFDAKTFKQLKTFPYQQSREGWGLAFNGKQILRTDGSHRIWLMNKDTYQEEGYIEVYDDKGEVDNLNEMEFIKGKIYANVYPSNKIVIIHPQSGKVEAYIDLSALVPKNFFKAENETQNNVLNGIAWDEKAGRLFITGKKWPKLYQITLQD